MLIDCLKELCLREPTVLQQEVFADIWQSSKKGQSRTWSAVAGTSASDDGVVYPVLRIDNRPHNKQEKKNLWDT